MSNESELKHRKSKQTTKSDESKNVTNDESNAKKAPVLTHDDIKRITEEKRKDLGKKLFKRSLKRIGLICVAFFALYTYRWIKTDQSFTAWVTKSDEILNVPFMKRVPCSEDYKSDREQFPKCAPTLCGRLVIDDLINERESAILLTLFKKALMLNPLSANQSASILDLHSGALSYEDKFVNVYGLLRSQKKQQYFTQTEFAVYRQVKDKIHKYIAKQFNIPTNDLYLTSPTFFSKLTELPAKNIHDEYWHLHIDKQTYKSFHYTSLLYLNTYYHHGGFFGGRFVFVDKEANYTIEPKQSRVSVFTSGSENAHFVERVEKGVRYAITISFTCDPQLAIDDPRLLV